MRTTTSILLLLLVASMSFGQATWVQLNNFQGPARKGGIAFSINGIGYFGTGMNPQGGFLKDFWQYNAANDTWTQKADVGGVPRYLGVGFEINGKGYIGTGNIGTETSRVESNDFYEYDPNTNIWTNRSSVGTVGRISGVGFGAGGKGYITTGYDRNVTYDNTLWEFNPNTNSWSQKANFPYLNRDGAIALVINGLPYITSGHVVLGFGTFAQQDLYVGGMYLYNQANDTWTPKASIPDAFYYATGTSIGGRGYVFGKLYDPNNPTYSRLLKYDQASNTWTKVNDSYPTLNSIYPSSFSTCHNLYVVGNNYSSSVFRITGEFDLSPSPICSTAQFSAANAISYQSSNPGILTINNSGLATRIGNSTGSVTVTANFCTGSAQTAVWVGIPEPPGPVSGETSPSVGSIYQYTSAYPASGNVDYHDWILPFNGDPQWGVSSGANTLALNAIVGSSSGWVQVYGHNACGNSGVSKLRVFPTGGGGGGIQRATISPNPSTTSVNINWKDRNNQEPYLVRIFDKNSHKVYDVYHTEDVAAVPVGNLVNGTYYLVLTQGELIHTQSLLVNH